MRSIPLRSSVSVVEDFVRLTHIRNPGVAFGLLSDRGIPFVLVSLVAMTLIVLSIGRVPRSSHALRISLAAILGGASGNLIDRLRFREVVDFIEVGVGSLRWPVFNIADIAVTTGVLLFIVVSLRGRREAGAAVERGPEDESAGDGVAGRETAAADDDAERGSAGGPGPGARGARGEGGTILGPP